MSAQHAIRFELTCPGLSRDGSGCPSLADEIEQTGEAIDSDFLTAHPRSQKEFTESDGEQEFISTSKQSISDKKLGLAPSDQGPLTTYDLKNGVQGLS